MTGSLLAEVQETIVGGSAQQRGQMLSRVTDLLLENVQRLTEEQVGVFDDVLELLISKIETAARIELSTRLALVENAPRKAIRTLACDDEIAVARPVLTHSPRLSEEDLLAIARSKGQKHLLAISNRRRIDTIVTDVLLERGDLEVIDSLVANPLAKFSERGLHKLARSAETDATLAEKLSYRCDVPTAIFEQLLMRATATVRNRLMMIMPDRRETLSAIVDEAAEKVRHEVARPRDLAETLLQLLHQQKSGTLDEAALVDYVKTQRYEELIVALGLLCSASLSVIEPLMRSPRVDGVLIPCRAANLSWPTVALILQNRFPHHRLSRPELSRAKLDYFRLSQATAQRLLRFWQVRSSMAEQDRASENRRRTRKLTLEPGSIEIPPNDSPVDCVILDITSGGACILVKDASALPLTFHLRMASTGTAYLCKRAWQQRNRIGVSFLAQPA
jgi:uncharacterized protein (DUF2336 family)